MGISFLENGVAYEVMGEGPLVVCSPGMGDRRDAFRPLAELLVEAGFRVALVDLRGHGDSRGAWDVFGDEATASDLIGVIERLGGGSAVIAGASMSAAAATIAAGRRPDLVSGLVLLGPFLRNGSGPLMRVVMSVLLAKPWGPSLWRSYSARLWPGLGEGAATRAAELTDDLRSRWSDFRKTAATDHSVVAPWLGRVEVPTLVAMGTADPDWSDPAAEADWVAEQFPTSRSVMVDGAGHAPMLERPSIVADQITGFLRELGGTRG